MTLPETDLARIRRWVDGRNDRLPPRAVGQVRYELDVDPRAVTLLAEVDNDPTAIFWG